MPLVKKNSANSDDDVDNVISKSANENGPQCPWPGLKLACIRILELYCKVFERPDYYRVALSRKNCKKCKCSRESHEVTAEHGARSRLGFTLAHDDIDPKRFGYAYVPCGLITARQIDQYYASLPSQEVPKLGSKAENVRLQRLVKQLPRQDLALSACKHIEPNHQSSYKVRDDGI